MIEAVIDKEIQSFIDSELEATLARVVAEIPEPVLPRPVPPLSYALDLATSDAQRSKYGWPTLSIGGNGLY